MNCTRFLFFYISIHTVCYVHTYCMKEIINNLNYYE